jgi:hypothetical protein
MTVSRHPIAIQACVALFAAFGWSACGGLAIVNASDASTGGSGMADSPFAGSDGSGSSSGSGGRTGSSGSGGGSGGSSGTAAGGCSAVTCAGCCDATGFCSLGLDNALCGAGGVLCTDCTATRQLCMGSACVSPGTSSSSSSGSSSGDSASAPQCSPEVCGGCCDSNGFCHGGQSAGVCGTGGRACLACSSGQGCTNGACVADSGGPPPTCTASSCTNVCIPVYQSPCCKSDGTCGCRVTMPPGACQ